MYPFQYEDQISITNFVHLHLKGLGLHLHSVLKNKVELRRRYQPDYFPDHNYKKMQTSVQPKLYDLNEIDELLRRSQATHKDDQSPRNQLLQRIFMQSAEIERLQQRVKYLENNNKNILDMEQQVEGLTQTINHWRNACLQKDDELDRLRAEYHDYHGLQNQNNLLNSEVIQLKNKIRYMEQHPNKQDEQELRDNNYLQHQLKQVTDKLTHQSQLNKQLYEENQLLQDENAQLKLKTRSKDEDLIKQIRELQAMNRDLQNKHNNDEYLRGTVNELQKEIDSLKHKLRAKDEDSHRQLRELQTLNRELQQELESHKYKTQNVREDEIQKQREMRELINANRDLIAQNRELQNEVEQLKIRSKKGDDTSRQMRDLQNSNRELQQLNKDLQAEIEQTKHKLRNERSKDDQMREMQSTQRDLQHQSKDLQASIRELQGLNKGLEQENQALLQEIFQLKNKLPKTDEQLRKLQMQNKELQADNIQLTQELKGRQKEDNDEIIRLQTENHSLNLELNRLKNKIKQLEQLTSHKDDETIGELNGLVKDLNATIKDQYKQILYQREQIDQLNRKNPVDLDMEGIVIKLNELQKRHSSLQSDYSKLKQYVESLPEESQDVIHLREQVAALKQQNQKMREELGQRNTGAWCV